MVLKLSFGNLPGTLTFVFGIKYFNIKYGRLWTKFRIGVSKCIFSRLTHFPCGPVQWGIRAGKEDYTDPPVGMV